LADIIGNPTSKRRKRPQDDDNEDENEIDDFPQTPKKKRAASKPS
jgi:hypothetical protein